MKFIVKGHEPNELRAWRLAQKSTPQNLRYHNMPGKTLDEIRRSLLDEQGYLCAYTMMRIATPARGHIEHIVAQSANHELQVDHSNMVFCYPGASEPRCPFGAQAKDDAAVSHGEFVSPLDQTCETRFLYRDDGSVSEAGNGDAAAKNTIAILKLDHPALNQARVAAIRRLPLFDRTKPRVSASSARKMALEFLARDQDGRFPEYAVALSQVMSKYAQRRAAKESAMISRR